MAHKSEPERVTVYYVFHTLYSGLFVIRVSKCRFITRQWAFTISGIFSMFIRFRTWNFLSSQLLTLSFCSLSACVFVRLENLKQRSRIKKQPTHNPHPARIEDIWGFCQLYFSLRISINISDSDFLLAISVCHSNYWNYYSTAVMFVDWTKTKETSTVFFYILYIFPHGKRPTVG